MSSLEHNVQMLILGCLIFRSDFKNGNDGCMALENPGWLCVVIKVMDASSPFFQCAEKELK